MLNFRLWLEAIEEKILTEINSKWIDEIQDYIDPSKLPFGNIFGKHYRIVAPYVPDSMQHIIDAIEEKGDKVDLKKGVVLKKVKSNQGPKVQEMRIGRYLQQAFPKSGMAETWNKEAGALSIIVSRHPIDVLRMSDFKALQSCHSEPNTFGYNAGQYFDCAVAEAKGQGGIAYLVKTSDLNKISDLDQEEIFQDKKRHVEGIVPLSRVRIRLFVHKHDGYDFAVPELAMYGDRRNDFITSVVNWAREVQPEIVKERPSMDDFTRKGGHYADYEASRLFNQFFDDDQDSGDADFEGDYSIEDQYEQECRSIASSFTFKHLIHGYYEVENYDGVMVAMGGNISFPFDPDELIGKIGEIDWRDREKIRREIGRETDIYPGDLEIGTHSDGRFSLDLTISTENYNSTPDGFREMMQDLSEIDESYDKIHSQIRMILTQLGHMESPHSETLIDTLHNEKFKNFDVRVEDSERIAYSRTYSPPHVEFEAGPITVGKVQPTSTASYDNKISAIPAEDGRFPGIDKIYPLLVRELSKDIQASFKLRQRTFADVAPHTFGDIRKESPPDPEKITAPEITVYLNPVTGEIQLGMLFQLRAQLSKAQTVQALRYIHWLDNHFPLVTRKAAQVIASLNWKS